MTVPDTVESNAAVPFPETYQALELELKAPAIATLVKDRGPKLIDAKAREADQAVEPQFV
jgi:hypothetical protein